MPQIISPTCITLTDVRVSYVNVFKPRQVKGQGEFKYSMCVLIHEDDTPNLTVVDNAIQAAIMSGLESGKLLPGHAQYNPQTKAISVGAQFKKPLHNGTDDHAAGKKGSEFKHHFYLNTNCTDAPTILINTPQGRVPIIDPAEFYSGCYAHVNINFAAYNNVSVGVGVYLNHVLKTEDGDRLDGRISAEDAFAAFDAVQPEVVNDDDIPF